MINKLIFIIFLVNLSNYAYTKPKVKTIRFASAQWCPYACSSAEKKGFVSETIRSILLEKNIKITIDFLPWKRAIKSVNDGKYDGLLTAVPSEAPKLIFTTVPTMTYTVCLNTLSPTEIKIQSINDLKKYKIGIASGFSYGSPFDEYIAKNLNNNEKILSLSGNNVIFRMLELTRVGRISFYIGDEFVARSINKNSKKVFCAKKTPFYIGFSPKLKDVKGIINILNKALSEK